MQKEMHINTTPIVRVLENGIRTSHIPGQSWKKDLIVTGIVTDQMNILVKEETEIEIKTEIEIDPKNEAM